MAENLNLELADGWREVPPKAGGPELLVEREGALFQIRSDFSERHAFGPVGPVDCPIAVDSQNAVAYRYVCESRLRRPDFSEIRAYNLKDGSSSSVFRFNLRHWVLWSLNWIEQRGDRAPCLLGLLASDVPSDERVEIRHQLFTLDPATGVLRLRPLCRDAYHPVAFSKQRGEWVFAGAEGIYIVGLSGERRSSLIKKNGPEGRGASFDPSGKGRVVLGGGGLYLWDFQQHSLSKWADQGLFPLWTGTAEDPCIWYSESSGDLFRFDPSTQMKERILGVRRNHNPERMFARPLQLSKCQRFLAVSLTGKYLKGVQRDPLNSKNRTPVYKTLQNFCILNVKEREMWRCHGFSSSFVWIDGR